MWQAIAYDLFMLKKSNSNLGVCHGHTNTTKVVTKFNDDRQIDRSLQRSIKQPVIITVQKCVKIMTTTFE
jgi:hypothetical protein